MADLFIKILNMSLSASWLILAVLALRLLLKKAPKWVRVLLWGLVAVRLLCPFAIESSLSLIPSAETIRPEIMLDVTPTVATGIATIDSAVNPLICQSSTPDPTASVNPLQVWFAVAANVWVLGIAAMLLYAVISYLHLHKKVTTAVKLRDNLYQSENVGSPFVLGVFSPRIYIPFQISEQSLNYVIAHEQAHIRRKDHLWKPLGFLLLAIHWFNPLVWLAYILLCRDIELACGEKVIKEMGIEERADYSAALLSCSVSRHMIAACPVAFGEVSVKTRVKSVLSYKKPAFWIILIAVILCTVVAVCFLTNPVGSDREPDLSFLNYENAISLIADEEEVQVIYYPDVTDETESFIKFGIASGNELARYLDNCQWAEVNVPRDALPSPGSVEFVIEDDYRITVYDRKEWSLRRYAKVSYGDETRYYSTGGNDYQDAVALVYSPSDNFNDVTVLMATVVDIQDGYYLVESTTSRPEQSSYDRFLVPIKNAYPSPEPSVGDIIEIRYKGQIPAGYPGKIPEESSFRVRFTWRDGALYHVITEEGVSEIKFSAPGFSGGCVTADGSEFPVGEEVQLDQFYDFTDLTGASLAALDKNGNILYSLSWPVEGTEVGVTETLPTDSNVDDTGFELNFAENTSMQNHFTLSDDNPYWQISVVNEGSGEIVMELEGEVYRIEAGTTEVFNSDVPWKPGTYFVSFASYIPNGMEGHAICKTASQAFKTE